MEKFALGEIKILICTNIVESGLDIQNANTIIIQDVQQFGLAQLYQVLFFLNYFWFGCSYISVADSKHCLKLVNVIILVVYMYYTVQGI